MRRAASRGIATCDIRLQRACVILTHQAGERLAGASLRTAITNA